VKELHAATQELSLRTDTPSAADETVRARAAFREQGGAQMFANDRIDTADYWAYFLQHGNIL
jgi:hypothetical protein